MTATYPERRLPAHVHAIDVHARYAAMGLLRTKLASALRMLLESGVPDPVGLDPREIAELLTALTFTLVDADTSPELFQSDPPMAYMPIGGLELAVQVLRRTGACVQSGVLAVPDIPAAADRDAFGQSYLDVADATQHMIEQIRETA
ncbi:MULTISPECIES: hypothetical protein [Rhodococcus]|jgi:hypothetical protein|uniref:hypothetical protein n=1 Tax=Rhodococcus TaxID=1827 RepID=UPI00110F3B7E|nr:MULTISPECIES: hypothetical protein [Rhodococcus]MCF8786140.1 hypothetical protein [Rhodococcus ruber]UTM40280.1 hypothetical protein MX572_25575 [Rhodococcus pyridinivorans]WAL49727.1 hypothetical protein OQN32_27330 [Rhodococcus pyridinivorans]